MWLIKDEPLTQFSRSPIQVNFNGPRGTIRDFRDLPDFIALQVFQNKDRSLRYAELIQFLAEVVEPQCAPSFPFLPIDGVINSNTYQPGLEGTLKPKTADISIGTQKGLLIHILDIAWITQHAGQNLQNSMIVFSNELVKCGAIALLNRPYLRLFVVVQIASVRSIH